jgi:Mannosyl-glycoprotein endo-beta-N-acetylglucosaminidase
MLLPLLLLACTNLAAGCLQLGGPPRLISPEAMTPPTTRPPGSVLNTLAAAPSARVLQPGNTGQAAVEVPPEDETTQPVVTSSRVRWVTNPRASMLWSSSRGDASAFTDLPEQSFLRIQGPPEAGRLPVYYAGDGLLRRPGDGWIDAGAVEAVDAPAPGQVPAIDALSSEPLPAWVQAHRASTLWSGPDEKAISLTDLPQWTFLRVAGLERDGRILVEYAGDHATRQAGVGWVDKAAVGPSGNPGQWVTNHRATPLWSGTDDSANRFTVLPQWTRLRVVDGAFQNKDRIEVAFFGDGARQAGLAWVARADVGPIVPPNPLPSAPQSSTQTAASTGVRQIETHTFSSESEFINMVGTAAQRAYKTTGVPASVSVAQAILESDWGRSRLTRQGNNLFGIKALGAPGTAGTLSLATWEHLDGSDVVLQQPFRAYYTLDESVIDHAQFFIRNRRYSDALAVANDARAFARAIQDDGYATDPSYADKLIQLMDRYSLYRFDA